MRKFQLCILFILCLSCFKTIAQNQKLISGNFAGYRFPQLVREIEKQTSYHIYYDSTDTDSLEINLNANELTLQQVFDAVFKGTDVHYAIANGSNSFSSKSFTIGKPIGGNPCGTAPSICTP